MTKDTNKPDWAMSKREQANAEAVARGETPKKRARWPWVVGVLAVIAVIGGVVASRTPAEAPTEVAADAESLVTIQLAPFEVTTIAPGPLQEWLKITGSLAPSRQVHISSEVTAKVTTVAVRAGDAVKSGDTLVEFDAETLQGQLDQSASSAEATRVQLEQARSDFERTKSLVERGLAANTNLEKARSALDQLTATLAAQEAAVDAAQRAVNKAVVTAPFDGVISERSIDPGQFVATGTPLLTIVDLTSMEVEATAPVTYAVELAPGQAVELAVEGFGDRTFAGTVERLNPVAIEGSRMLPVYVALANDSGELRGGMFTSGRIVLEEKPDAIGLPLAAIRRDVDSAWVITVEDGRSARRDVVLTRSWDGGAVVEVAEGLAPGDVVVIEPLAELKPGMAVELVE